MNSRKSVPSTGKFPPTPKPLEGYQLPIYMRSNTLGLGAMTHMKEMKTHRAVKFGAEPAMTPNTPPMTRVQFQAIRRLPADQPQRHFALQASSLTLQCRMMIPKRLLRQSIQHTAQAR